MSGSRCSCSLQHSPERTWINVGIDHHIRTLPEWLQPGAGLRPFAVEHAATSEERTRLRRIEAEVPRLFAAIYTSAAAHAREGYVVVMDVGHHGAYPQLCDAWQDCARRLDGLHVL